MLRFLFTITLFVSGVTFAYSQETWRVAADKLLESHGTSEWDIARFELLEVLRQRLSEAFGKDELDIRLIQMLAIWEIEEGNSGSPYLEHVMASYANAPLMKALFLLDLMRVSFGELHLPTETRQVLTMLRELKLDSSRLYVHALLETASVHAARKEFQEARKHLTDAQALVLQIGGEADKLYNDVLIALSDYYARIGNIEQSVVYQENAVRNFRQYHGVRQPYHSLFGRKTTEINPSDYSGREVEDLCRIADLLRYAISPGMGDQPSIYRLYTASLLFDEIAAHADRGRDLEFDVWVDRQRANLALARGDYGSASTLLEGVVKDMLRFRPLAHILIREADARNLLGCAYLKEGKFAEAEAVFREVERRAHERYAHIADVTTKLFHNRILALMAAGETQQLREALDHLVNPAAGIYIELDHGPRMALYAQALYRSGDFQAAFALYQRLYDQYWSEASFAYSQQEAAVDDFGDAAMINEVNLRLQIGDSTVTQFIYPYKPHDDTYKNILGELALAAFQTGAFESAASYALEHINEFYDALDKSHSHLERGTDLYEIYRLKEVLFPYYDLFLNVILIDSLSDAADKRKRISFAHVLDAKGNLQYEYRHMRTAIENSADESLKEKFGEYLKHREALVALKAGGGDPTEIERLTIEINTLTAYFSGKTALFEGIDERFVFWHEVKEQLAADEVAVEIKRFTTMRDGSVVYAAYIVAPETSSPEIVFLKNGVFLEGRGLKKYQNAIQARVEDLTSYGDYWKPIADKLGPHVRKIYFSPDGVYSQINVHTLFNPTTRRYVVDDLTVYSVVSTKDLLRREADDIEIRSAILMGRPAYLIDDKSYHGEFDPVDDTPERALTRAQIAAGHIADLPGTEKEVMAVAKLMKKRKITTNVFTGSRATEEQLKRSSADVLHLATHGFWYQENPEVVQADAMFNSGLLFAGVRNFSEGKSPGADDGILTAYEVQGMDLRGTQLAVLSACETGLGHVEVGEGVYGLQRAFSIAGVNRVMMSLWKVDDEATRQLFESFYNYWIADKLPLDQAFRQAQADLKARFHHPYYWGAFILVN